MKLCQDDYRLLRKFAPRHDGAWCGYLKVVTANLVHDHFRSVRSERNGGGQELLELNPGTMANPGNDIEQKLALAEVDQVLQDSAVSRRDQQIFWLYYRQGFTARAISELREMFMSVKGVESTIYRLTKLVREKVGASSSDNTRLNRSRVVDGKSANVEGFRCL